MSVRPFPAIRWAPPASTGLVEIRAITWPWTSTFDGAERAAPPLPSKRRTFSKSTSSAFAVVQNPSRRAAASHTLPESSIMRAVRAWSITAVAWVTARGTNLALVNVTQEARDALRRWQVAWWYIGNGFLTDIHGHKHCTRLMTYYFPSCGDGHPDKPHAAILSVGERSVLPLRARGQCWAGTAKRCIRFSRSTMSLRWWSSSCA